MRLRLMLTRVELSAMNLLSVCPYESCQGRHFRHHQEVEKPLKDTEYASVSAQRNECLRCKRTFRLCPKGVTRAQNSQRVKGLGGDVVPAGAELWGYFSGLGGVGRVPVQGQCL
jgi:hypothetical protein